MPSERTVDWREWWSVNRQLLRHPRGIHDSAGDVGTAAAWDRSIVRPPPDPWAKHPSQDDHQAIAKALGEVLQQGGERELIAEALVALTRIGDPSPYLEKADPDLRHATLVATGIVSKPPSATRVMELLDEEARAVAGGSSRSGSAALWAYCLGGLGAWSEEPRSGDVAQFLCQHLRSTDDPLLVGALVQGLGVAYLQRLAPRPQRVSLPERLDLLLALLADTGRAPEVRAMAAWALPRSVRRVDGTAAERWAASAIPRVAETLLTHASDAEAPPALRRQALLALGSLGRGALPHALRTRMLEALANAARADDVPSAASACLATAVLASDENAMGELPARAAALLVDRLDGPEPLRPWAALACGLLGWELAPRRYVLEYDKTLSNDFAKQVDALGAALHEHLVAGPDADAYAIGAVLSCHSDSFLWLLGQLGTAAPARARELALAFGQAIECGPEYPPSKELESMRAAIPMLRERMRGAGGDAELLVALAHVRKWLGDRTLGMDLLPGVVVGEPSARCAWIDALAVTESARALEPLTKLLADREQPVTVRVHAARALGELANKEFLPWTAVFLHDLDLAVAPATLLDSTKH